MVVDTSALLAILTGEPERRSLNEKIARSSGCFISAGSYLETTIVIEARFGYEGVRNLEFYRQAASLAVVPFDAEQVELARRAYVTYGKGGTARA